MQDITLKKDSDRGVLKNRNYLEIKVSDTGTGIDPHIVENIFEPYFTTKSPDEGTGLGLALVHGIVDSLGGEIFVDSKIGQETIFTIYLPTCKSADANLHHDFKEVPEGREHILLVDDEVSIVKYSSQMLSQLGYSVTSTTKSLEALEIFRKSPNNFDLVISDVTMPDMTGDDLARKLIQIRPGIAVILSTGYSKKVLERQIQDIGVKAIVSKPIVKVELAKVVRSVLDQAGNQGEKIIIL